MFLICFGDKLIFTVPHFSIGPKGSAICVYSAENTGPNGLNRGIFEVFREDLVQVRPDGTTEQAENNHEEVC